MSSAEIADEAELLCIDDTAQLRHAETNAVLFVRHLSELPIQVPLLTRRGTPLRRIDNETIAFGAKNKRIAVSVSNSSTARIAPAANVASSSSSAAPVATNGLGKLFNRKETNSSSSSSSNSNTAAEIERLRKLGIQKQLDASTVKTVPSSASASAAAAARARANAAVQVKMTAKMQAKLDAARAARSGKPASGNSASPATASPGSASPASASPVIAKRVIADVESKPSKPSPTSIAPAPASIAPTPASSAPTPAASIAPVVSSAPVVAAPAPAVAVESVPSLPRVTESVSVAPVVAQSDVAPEPDPIVSATAPPTAPAVAAVVASEEGKARSSSFGSFWGRAISTVMQFSSATTTTTAAATTTTAAAATTTTAENTTTTTTATTTTTITNDSSIASETVSNTALTVVESNDNAGAVVAATTSTSTTTTTTTDVAQYVSRAIAAVASNDDPNAQAEHLDAEEPVADITEAELAALKARALDPTLAPFLIDAKTALSSFEAWKKSLWFVPEDFLARLELAQCRAVFVPYYVFSAAATSVHVGSIGFVDVAGREPRWLDAQEAVTCQHIKQVRTQAQADDDTNAVPLRVLLELDDGFDASLARPDAAPLSEPSLLGVAVSWREAFAKRIYKEIVRNERYGAADALRKEHNAQLTRGAVQTETTLTNVGYRLVYLPLYSFDYEYRGEKFAFAVNGQTGVVHGERPYGVGSTKASTLRALTGNFLGGSDRVRLVVGDELARDDGVTGCYGGADSFYLLLPSSDQFLLVFSIGWVVLGNAGPSEMRLQAQRRMRAPAGLPECRLAPGERKRFSYCGHWLVHIVAGNPADLRCLAFGTNGGEATDDELKMCN
jgi:hypothetical protein